MNTKETWVDDYQLKPQVATLTNLAAAEDANKSTNIRHFRCDADGAGWSGGGQLSEVRKIDAAVHEHKS